METPSSAALHPPETPLVILGRLLIVDDEFELMTALCETLTARGYDALGCTSAKEALEALQAQEFDLLLTDLMMPDMDGIELMQAALACDPYLVSIIMTGQGTVQTAVDAMRVGAFDYVLKPFKVSVLHPVLSRAMHMRRLRMENLQLRETVAIFELTKVMALTLDLPTILNKVADAALQQCEADEASILLPASDGRELYVAVVRGEGREHLLGERVSMERGIAGWVARHQEPLMLHGDVADPRFAPINPRADIRSALAVPMVLAGELVGVLNVNATNRRRPFALGQVKALSILASVAASEVKNALLFQDVRAAEEQYRAIFEHAVDGIFQSTPGGRYLSANPALARILGYDSPAELLAAITDASHQLYVEPERRAQFKQALEAQGFVRGFESTVRRKDGRVIWISENARAVCDARGALLYYEGFVQDITERRRAEELVQRQREALMQSEKLGAMGQLLAGVAHELNNPLSVVLGQTALLKEMVGSGPLVGRAERISNAGNRCAQIVKNFLALARHRPIERQAVRLNQVVQEALELVAYPLRVDNVEVTLDLADDLPVLWADPHQLHQVVINLVSNAHQAMQLTAPPHRLTLTTRFEPAIARVTLTVADTGLGISPELRERIFEPFFTTKPSGQGTGLGLSLCHGIVSGHGGTIRVRSNPGQGAVFVVELPVEAIPGQVEVRALDAQSPARGKAILVVDDEPDVASMLADMLALDGHHVETAANGATALDKLRKQTYDIILSDLRMPVLDGPGLYTAIERRHPDLLQRIIFLTGDTLGSETQTFLEWTSAPTLSKPFTAEELRRVVQRVLQAG